jgi:hypothetical protein
MNSTLISISAFFMATIFFYVVMNPKLTLGILADANTMRTHVLRRYKMLSIYFFIVVVSQIAINIFMLIKTCGGSVVNNIGSALLITIIPWVIIFGAVIAVVNFFPGFKSAFSNVIGYYVVAGSAKKVLSELLVNVELDTQIDEATSGDTTKKDALKATADTMLKMFGDLSVMINQIVPSNFNEYWKMITPMMKQKYQDDNASQGLKEQLLNIVGLRDNIGEGMWFVYTALLLIAITQYQIISRGCKNNLTGMKEKQQDFQKAQSASTEQAKKASAKTYTI